TNESANFGELRQITRANNWSLTVGGGIFRSSFRQALSSGGFPIFDTTSPITHNNAYAYLTFNHSSALTTTLGVSYDAFNDGIPVDIRNQFNPKVGITWNPWQGGMFR